MRTIEEIRHQNLLTLLGQFPTVQAFADKVGRSHSQISQLKNRNANSGSGKPRNMDSKVARLVEQELDLEPGWMDNDHSRYEWPFSNVDRQQWEALPQEAKVHVQKGLASLLAQYAEVPPLPFKIGPGEFTSGATLQEKPAKPYRTGTR